MLILILLLIIGTGMAYISKNNLTPVTLNLGTYIFSDIPLFYVIIGSLVTGLVLAYIIHFINSLFTAYSMYKKDKKITEGKSEIVDLTKQVHQLELTNERLKNNSTPKEPQDKNAL